MSDPRAEASVELEQLLANPILRAVADAWVASESDGQWLTLDAKMKTYAQDKRVMEMVAWKAMRHALAIYAPDIAWGTHPRDHPSRREPK